MGQVIKIISSMATRRVLVELVDGFRRKSEQAIEIESVGGVDAAKRVRAGERFDLVILAADVIAKLVTEGHIASGSPADFVRSPMAAAVRAGTAHPVISDEKAIKTALLSSRTIGYSTGPSGAHLLTILKAWGLDPEAEPARFVQAKSGVPVAQLVARGEAEIGVQQLSELLDEPGVDVVGLLPAPVQLVTAFSIGVGVNSESAADARALIAYLNGPGADATKRKFGMEPR
jgi:molybdate transport system substrate-binding protein